MPLPTIPGVVRASASGVIAGGSHWSNTWHFRRIDLADPVPADIAALHVELLVFYAALGTGFLAGVTSLDVINYTPLDGTSGAVALPGPGDPGGDGASALPPEVAEVITIRTAGRGRRARGRIFLPAISETHNVGGRLTSAAVLGLTALADALAAAAVVSGWQVGVASYGRSMIRTPGFTDHRISVSSWDPFFTPATSLTVDNKFDVQRSRKS